VCSRSIPKILGGSFGEHPLDQTKAMEYTLGQQILVIGRIIIWLHLLITYHPGDTKKAKIHYEAAAMAGNEVARNTLGCICIEFDLAPHVADMSATCRRHVHMSPNLGRHCVSLRHRRGPDIPNLYQLLPTSTNQPKHTGTSLGGFLGPPLCTHTKPGPNSRLRFLTTQPL